MPTIQFASNVQNYASEGLVYSSIASNTGSVNKVKCKSNGMVDRDPTILCGAITVSGTLELVTIHQKAREFIVPEQPIKLSQYGNYLVEDFDLVSGQNLVSRVRDRSVDSQKPKTDTDNAFLVYNIDPVSKLTTSISGIPIKKSIKASDLSFVLVSQKMAQRSDEGDSKQKT
jgi:hypothetical protein